MGRWRQLNALLQLVAVPPVVVRLEGEAGVGKTRLLHELFAHSALGNHQKLIGTCQSLREPFPLGPVVDALLPLASAKLSEATDPLLGALVPLLPELGSRLPPPLPPLADLRMEQHRRYRAISSLLTAAGPAVLVLDDLHWADSGTMEFLQYLFGHLPAELTVVLSYRPGELPRGAAADLGRSGSAATIELPVLAESETAAMLHAMVGRGRPPRKVRQALQRRSGGIPFAVEQIVHSALEQLHPASVGSTAWDQFLRDDVPAGFREAIARRLSGLSDTARRLVVAAAVLAVPVGEEELFAVADVPVDAGELALDDVLDAGLLQETNGRFACRHELLQQAVRQVTSRSSLRRLHRRAASVLLDASGALPYFRIASHLEACGDLDGWRDNSELGADTAISVGDTGAAVTTLLQLIAAAEGDEAGRLALKLGRAALDGLDCGATVELLRALVNEVQQLPLRIRGELRNDLGLLLLNQLGDATEGYRELERAAGELREPRPDLAARVMSSLANIHAGHQHVDTHLKWLTEADSLAGAIAEPSDRTAFLVNKATTLMTCGQRSAWPLADSLFEETTDPALGRHKTRACLNFADASLWLGHYGRASGYLASGRELASRFTAAYTREQLEVAEAMLDWMLGRWDALPERTVALVNRFESLPRVAAECRLIAGALAAEHGDVDQALQLIHPLVSADQPPAPPVTATAHTLLAEVRLRQSARTEALRNVDLAVQVLRRTGMWVWAGEVTPSAVEVLTTLRRPTDAQRLIDEHREGIAGLDCPASAAALRFGEAVVAQSIGNFHQALDGYLTAEVMFSELPRPFWLARTKRRLGECQLQLGLDGIPQLLAAERLFDELGVRRRSRSCREVLREQQAAPQRKRGRPSYGERLSPRELEVAALAAAGQTNQQIATALGLSRRTIEQHVARCLHKLHVSSRKELTVVLASGIRTSD
ncbi:LuxR C-terminal-related transcriptional regulator [Kribbella sp. CA-293567]|nr:LuxR family transcriptional regulator [Kribbella sp. CA-293567]WBQ08688.1 LuxR C-terminal-related transcriptional regulator [Kribbella sp. CA-293567]